MKNKTGLISVLTATFLVGTLSANAALAPNYQRARELTEIVNLAAAEFPEKLIEQVIHERDNIYKIVFDECSVSAHIVPEEAKATDTPILGPLQFTVKFETPVCEK